MGLEIIAGVGEKLEFLVKDPAPPCWKLGGFGRKEVQLVGSRKMGFGNRGAFPIGLGGCSAKPGEG